eukprot:scaffold85647_cov26-Attheya_sp.AAC.1
MALTTIYQLHQTGGQTQTAGHAMGGEGRGGEWRGVDRLSMLGPFCMAAAFIPDYLWDCGVQPRRGEQHEFSFHRNGISL